MEVLGGLLPKVPLRGILLPVVLPSLVLIAALSAGCRSGNNSGQQPGTAAARVRPLGKLSDVAPDQIDIKPSESGVVPSGTVVPLITYDVLDSHEAISGSFGYAAVDEDVKGADGKTAIPKGSPAVITIAFAGRDGGMSLLSLSLYQFSVDGKSFTPGGGLREFARLELKVDSTVPPHLSSVHLSRQSRLDFKLNQTVRLK